MLHRFLEEEKWNYYVLIAPILFFIIVFFFWAGFSEIDEVVRGEGKVVPSGQTKVLQHFEGGIVAQILVREGDIVERGKVIYRLSNESFNADFKSKEIDLMAYEAKAIRLKALINDEKELKFLDEYTQNIPHIIENEINIFHEQKSTMKNNLAIAEDQLNQKKLKHSELKLKFNNLSIEHNLAIENMQIQEDLLRKKVISKKEYIQELAKKQRIYTQIEEIRNNIPIVKEEINEWQRKAENQKLEIRTKFLQEYSSVQIEIKKLKEKNRANIDRDLRKEVISPVKGIVNKLYFHTVGGIVKQGDQIAEITPMEDTLMIEGKIKALDRALIWIGQKVSIEITAYDFSKYGLLEGRLMGIAPDSTMNKSGESFYIVKIEAKNYSFDSESPIMLGMIANINILSGKKTILEYLIKPLKDISKNSLGEK